MSTPLDIDLMRLAGIWRLRPSLLQSLNEAAAVMFDRYHAPPAPPAEGMVDHDEAATAARVNWEPPGANQIETHANDKDATEDGAYPVAFATAYALERYVVVRRANQGSGADYLLVREGEPENDFVKLEVSGTADGTDAQVRSRMVEKLAQLRGGNLQRRGVAVVVRFRDARIVVRRA